MQRTHALSTGGNARESRFDVETRQEVWQGGCCGYDSELSLSLLPDLLGLLNGVGIHLRVPACCNLILHSRSHWKPSNVPQQRAWHVQTHLKVMIRENDAGCVLHPKGKQQSKGESKSPKDLDRHQRRISTQTEHINEAWCDAG